LERLLAETKLAAARAEATAARAGAEAALLRAENEEMRTLNTAGGLLQLTSVAADAAVISRQAVCRRRTNGPGSGHPLTQGVVASGRLTARICWTKEEEAELLRLLCAHRRAGRPNWTKVMAQTGGVLLPGSPTRSMDSLKAYCSKFFKNLGTAHVKK